MFGDFLLRTRSKEIASVTRIVRIDSTDEECIFGDAGSTGRALVSAVNALAASSPAVIVVDIDTSDPKNFPEGFKLPSFSVPVIWAVNAYWEEKKEGIQLQPGRVLGGRLRDLPPYGIARMPVGGDGFLREWQRTVEVNGKDEPTLPATAVEIYCKSHNCGSSKSTSFTRDYLFTPIKLSEIISSNLPLFRSEKDCPTDRSTKTDLRLSDKVVVLGGFHEGSDRHDTPWGTKFGAEVVGSAIEEEVRPDNLGRLSLGPELLMKGLIAFVIAALHHFLRPLWATAFTLLFLPVAVVISGCVVFWFADYELTVVPFVVGILIEQLANSAEKAEHFSRHIEHLP